VILWGVRPVGICTGAGLGGSEGIDAAEGGDAIGGGAPGGGHAVIEQNGDLGIGQACQVVVGDDLALLGRQQGKRVVQIEVTSIGTLTGRKAGWVCDGDRSPRCTAGDVDAFAVRLSPTRLRCWRRQAAAGGPSMLTEDVGPRGDVRFHRMG
jgi:hypothetical protein